MLDAEEARARLNAIRDERWKQGASRRVGKLKRALRPAGEAILAPDPPFNDPKAREAFAERLTQAGTQLDTCSPSERVDLLSALHPKLGPVLARWWVDARAQPYTVGWARRAFRAPNNPELTRRRRAEALRAVLERVGPYDHDAVWLAAWAPHLGHEQGGYSTFAALLGGPLLAAAIDEGGPGGDHVFATLLEIGRGEHAIGVMDRHVVVGLLRAARPEGWDFVERLLLAAQRQEGLRQTILEAADEAHPDAFDRLLALIVEHNLCRFAATVRAVTVWLGFSADVEQIPLVATRLEQLRELRRSPPALEHALASDDGWQAYIALCALAMRDVVPAIKAASDTARAASVDVRAASVRFLAAAALKSSQTALLASLDDPDLAVATLAHAVLGPGAVAQLAEDGFERLERLAQRLPEKPRPAGPIGVEHAPIELSRARVVTSLLACLGSRPLSRLMPWFPAMDPQAHERFARLAGEQAHVTPDVRDALIRLLGDRSARVRQSATEAIDKLGMSSAEAPALEALLTRKAGDLRRGLIKLLSKQPPGDAIGSAQRLWASGDAAQRDAACELLRTLGPDSEAAVSVARAFAEDAPTERQQELLDEVVGVAETPGANDPGLGLYDEQRRMRVPAPSKPRSAVRFSTDTALRIVSALDDLAESHRDTTLTVLSWQGSREMLLADAKFLPSPFARRPLTAAAEGDDEGSGLILPEVFRAWWDDRPPDLREDESLDALRALAAVASTGGQQTWLRLQRTQNTWWAAIVNKMIGGNVGELRHAHVVHHVLSWLLVDHASAAVVTESLDALELALASVPKSVLRDTPKAADDPRQWGKGEWRYLVTNLPWPAVLNGLLSIRPDLFTDDVISRWFLLMRWLDEPVPGARRQQVDRRILLRAHDIGVASDDDLYDALFNPQSRLLKDCTRRRRAQLEDQHPRAVALADRLRERVLDVERARGELATPASPLALQLGSVSGSTLAMEFLARLGRASLVRGWLRSNLGREAVFSHLLRVSHPGEHDDATALRGAAADAGVNDTKLVELAMFAPQWATRVEDAIGWPGLAEAIWWFHAHTKDEHWSVDQEIRDTWAALSAERTPLSGADLVAGAVDVDWFARCHETLGVPRWKTVHAAAKLASGGNGHRRAQLFAEAMLGEVSEAALVQRITAKRHQDSVRALGLIPLPGEESERQAVALRRYGILREFERGSSKFGSQRQASERTAVRIGVENLARTTGAPDPLRFVWAMEAAEAGALADGPISVREGDVTVTLGVTSDGTPDLEVRRGDKKLAAIPAALRKHEAIAGLRDRKTALTRQASRVRASLEAAMVRQDSFAPDDFAALQRHPVVAPMLELLIFTNDDGVTMRRASGGFVDAAGSTVKQKGAVRLAHPVDLLASGSWIGWQEQLFVAEQRQPFKQAFRELYTVTEAERAGGPGTHRYEGHQVQPRQAMALLGRRGWLTDREAGDVSRVFHRHELVARLEFLDGFLTPAEVELPTIRAVYFTRPGEHLAQPLDAIPPIVFSEAMRDIDLVVSVAHAGGVDPEATASTVEMRAALVRETTRLLKLDNVREVNAHVVIEGALGEYSVHLGSGVVHRRPGGAVCIIPVDSQRRGRIFLPFADDDPKTAEVLAKVLLLARDTQIKDPTILEQLRS